MSKRYEYYNTGDNTFELAYQDRWLCQTFTPHAEHFITMVKLLLYKVGIPTVTTARIRATNVIGEPIAPDLTLASFDGSTLTDDAAGEWKTLILPALRLEKDTKYAIVLTELANIVVGVGWRREAGGDFFSYPYGAMGLSLDAGTTWMMDAEGNGGYMFEEWGNPALKWKGNILIDQLIYQHAERMVR